MTHGSVNSEEDGSHFVEADRNKENVCILQKTSNRIKSTCLNRLTATQQVDFLTIFSESKHISLDDFRCSAQGKQDAINVYFKLNMREHIMKTCA